MRLLQRLPGGDFKLVSFNDEAPPPYAILSHTWTEGQEVTYNELVAGTGREKTGYDKILFCGRRAAADSLQYFWVDTCCIEKSTSRLLGMFGVFLSLIYGEGKAYATLRLREKIERRQEGQGTERLHDLSGALYFWQSSISTQAIPS
jgi:hypothetical protein